MAGPGADRYCSGKLHHLLLSNGLCDLYVFPLVGMAVFSRSVRAWPAPRSAAKVRSIDGFLLKSMMSVAC
jgi:hypothetical protein